MCTACFLAEVGCKTKQTEAHYFPRFDIILIRLFSLALDLEIDPFEKKNLNGLFFLSSVSIVSWPRRKHTRKNPGFTWNLKPALPEESLHRIIRMKRARPRPWFIRLPVIYYLERAHKKIYSVSEESSTREIDLLIRVSFLY